VKILGVFSLTGAMLGVATVAVWGWSFFSLGLVPPLDEESEGRIAIHFLSLILFRLGIPLFCLPALAFGVLSRRMWTGRLGLAGAGLSLVLYLLFWALVKN
jgi:hypothetical protein